jgi:hypothetical protein
MTKRIRPSVARKRPEKRPPPKRPVKMQTYSIISEAVSTGLGFGLRRIFKHDGSPKTEEQVLAATDWIENEILNALCEVIRFDDGND